MPRPVGSPCPSCGKVYLSSGLQQHILRCEPGNVKYECSFCKNFFPLRELLHHTQSCACRPLRDGVVRAARAAPDRRVCKALDAGEASIATAAALAPTMPCRHCTRNFAPHRLHVHEHACTDGRQGHRARPVFDSATHRLSHIAGEIGLPLGRALSSSRSGQIPTTQARRATDGARARSSPGRDWRSQHTAFQAMIRSARGVPGVASTSPARGMYNTEDNREECPSCFRKFAPSTAERHIPACARTIARPRPPPSAGSSPIRPSTVGWCSPRGSPLKDATSTLQSDWPAWLTQQGQAVSLGSNSSPVHVRGGSPGYSPSASPYRSYGPVTPVTPVQVGRPSTSQWAGGRGGGPIASNVTSPGNPLANFTR